ncbi:MAG: VCBS repeat-containing protein [Chlorobiota bacterium]
MRRKTTWQAVVGWWGLCCAWAAAQVPYAKLPQWESVPQGFYATGLALTDVDGNGLPDVVVACGNDMERQPVVVYANATGLPERQPTWSSADSGYHGHLAVADVDGDGWEDVAVTEYLGEGGFGSPGGVKLYWNRQGRLEEHPSWRARERFHTFRCAWGDVDGDGRPDLAVAGGEAYTLVREPVRVYRNRGGYLEEVTSWRSAESLIAYDLAWEDINGDGWLDLIVACSRGPSCVFYNRGGQLDTLPGWRAAETEFANSLAVGDVDGDGWVDVVISFNRQLGGSGTVALFRNRSGELERLPSWRSRFSGYGSGVALVDLDGDGDLDLLTGAWWDTVRIYQNEAGNFAPEPQWSSQTRSVVEAFAIADVNADGLDTVTWRLRRKGSLVRFPVAPVERVVAVQSGGRLLQPSQYTVNRAAGWMSLPTDVADTVEVTAVISSRRDIAVSNWDPDRGNFLFLWQPTAGAVAETGPGVRVLEAADGLLLSVDLPEAGMVMGQWVDVRGESLLALALWLPRGRSCVRVPLPPSRGPYWLRLQTPAGTVVLRALRL